MPSESSLSGRFLRSIQAKNKKRLKRNRITSSWHEVLESRELLAGNDWVPLVLPSDAPGRGNQETPAFVVIERNDDNVFAIETRKSATGNNLAKVRLDSRDLETNELYSIILQSGTGIEERQFQIDLFYPSDKILTDYLQFRLDEAEKLLQRQT